jgi:uncharacterized protein YjbI with pentapeptide repeats
MKRISSFFMNEDFKTKILKKIERGKDLSKENFIGKDLSYTTFDNVDFSGLNLQGVICTGSKFHNAKFIGTKLNDAILVDTEFDGANLTNVILNDADLTRARLIGVKLNDADLTEANLTDANLTGSELKKTKFNKTILTHTILYGAFLSYNDLKNSDLSSTRFVPETFPSNKQLTLSYVDLRNSHLYGVDLRGSKLIGSIFDGANLSNSRLEDSDFTHAKLQHANLSYANLSNAIFRGANLTDAILPGANLTNANFVSAKLINANLDNVILNNTKFLSASLDGSSLTLENIRGTNSKIRGATISRTNLSFPRYKMPSRTRTKKFVGKLKRMTSTTKPENCITILIVAHGGVFPNTNIGSNLLHNVNMSQMSGGIDVNGLFGYISRPITPIINKYDRSIVYRVSSNRASADASLDVIYQVYPYLLEKYNSLRETKCAETFYSIFKDIVYYIKNFYANAGYTDFPLRDDYELYGENFKKHRESFAIYNSFQEKTFSFVPEPYEYCMTMARNSCSKLAPERTRQLTYGITLLQSSVPEDQPYTLAGLSITGGDYKDAILSNWKQDVVRNYWRQKIEDRRIINQEQTDEYLRLYEIISSPLDPEGLYLHPDVNKTRILLSELLELLKMGMGFTNINIIDYSCNECEFPISTLKRGAIDVKNSVPHMKEYRRIRTSVRNRPGGLKEWTDITNPPFHKIVRDIGKAASDQQKIRGKSKTIKRKSFGGKIKTKR